MIRINEICEALKNVCGWEQSYDPAKAIDDKRQKRQFNADGKWVVFSRCAPAFDVG